MRPIDLHRNAASYLRRMPADRRIQMETALREVAAAEDPLALPNVQHMSGEWSGCARLRVGRYRAIFHLVDLENVETLEVLAIGPRGDIY
jgi:mRNA-degrading endonuclease RelE of RelBE toxin-antitoxin system